MNIINLDETQSTNQYLQELLKNQECEEGTCVRAGFQTAGRGQQGNFWESEAGKNLTFSLVLYPDFISIAGQFIISQVVSLALKNVLNHYTEGITVKWPNDIYWHDKKIAGILIENSLISSQIEHSIIGIGLNINQEDFQSNAPNPVSLKQITGQDYDLDILHKEMLNSIFNYYLKLIKGGAEEIRKEYLESLYRNEGFHPYSDENGIFNAKVESVQENGRLCLLTGTGERRLYYFKEVAFIQE